MKQLKKKKNFFKSMFIFYSLITLNNLYKYMISISLHSRQTVTSINACIKHIFMHIIKQPSLKNQNDK